MALLIISLAFFSVVPAHANVSFPVVPLKPTEPFKLSTVFPVLGLTTLPVVSWSEIVNIVGTPSTTSNDVSFKSVSVLLLSSLTSTLTSESWVSISTLTLSLSSSLIFSVIDSTSSLFGSTTLSSFSLKSTLESISCSNSSTCWSKISLLSGLTSSTFCSTWLSPVDSWFWPGTCSSICWTGPSCWLLATSPVSCFVLASSCGFMFNSIPNFFAAI